MTNQWIKSLPPTFKISNDGKSITCLACQLTSYSIYDIEECYCGKCQTFHVVDHCSECGKVLDDTRIFGVCRPCAEVRAAARKLRRAQPWCHVCNLPEVECECRNR